MELAEVEQRPGLTLPQRHRLAVLNLADPIHEACDFLLPWSPHEGLRLVAVHDFLHAPERPDPWPDFLVAFASNGCGDYFAYDLRRPPATIVYLDPVLSVAENLLTTDRLEYQSFEAWYQSRRSRNQVRETGW